MQQQYQIMVYFTRSLKIFLTIFVICTSLNCALADEAAIANCKAIMDNHFGPNVKPITKFCDEYLEEEEKGDEENLLENITSIRTILDDIIIKTIFALDIAAGNFDENIESYYRRLIEITTHHAIEGHSYLHFCERKWKNTKINQRSDQSVICIGLQNSKKDSKEIMSCKKEIEEKFGEDGKKFYNAVYFNKLGDKNDTLVDSKNPNIKYYTHTPDSYGGKYLYYVTKNVEPAEKLVPHRYCELKHSQVLKSLKYEVPSTSDDN